MNTKALSFSQADQDLFARGLAQLGCPLSDAQQSACLWFLSELHLWGRAFNMTAIQDPQQMIIRHLLDSLSAVPYLHGDRILDVGTGAGLPGIPLSIARSDCDFYLLDSNQKKQIFVGHVIKKLQLNHAQGIHRTVQAYQVTPKFSTIITRAFASLPEMIALTAHLLSEEGRFLAMMGKPPAASLSLPAGFEMEAVVPLTIPFGTGERHIVKIKRHQ